MGCAARGSIEAVCAVFALALLCGGAPARAEEAPALLERAAVTSVDGLVLFRPGDLLVGDPDLPGRPAVRPLAEEQQAVLPERLEDWEILSEGCAPAPDASQQPVDRAGEVLVRGDLGGDGSLEQVRVERRSPMSQPRVLVHRGDALVGQGLLPVPAVPCRGLIAEAEPEGQPLLLLVWTSRGAERTTVGVTVFELEGSQPAVAY